MLIMLLRFGMCIKGKLFKVLHICIAANNESEKVFAKEKALMGHWITFTTTNCKTKNEGISSITFLFTLSKFVFQCEGPC